MALANHTMVQLVTERLATVDVQSKFYNESWKQIADNLRHPTGHEPDPQPNAAAGVTIPIQPFVFGAKSQHCLKAASNLVQYYDVVGRSPTAPNMQWDSIIKALKNYWKFLTDRKKNDVPDVPKISKSLPVIMWTE